MRLRRKEKRGGKDLRGDERDGDAILCRHGSFYCPDDTYIGKGLKTYGEYSETEVQFLCSLVKPDDNVVEVGANIGAITIPLARRVVPGFVMAFEPQTDIVRMLRANVDLNDLRANVTVEHLGLSDQPGVLRYTPNNWNTGAVSLSDSGDCEIGVKTLDNFNLQRIDLLKVDVEGMEWEVLRGARDTIKRCRPLIYCEHDFEQKSQRLISFLFSLGYRIFRHEPPLYNPGNLNGIALNLWPRVVSVNLLCVPEERELPQGIDTLVEIEKETRWVAVCRFGGIGDNLVAAGVLPELKRQGFKVEVITNKMAGEVFENNPWIDKLSICQDGDQPDDFGLQWQLWFQKRSHEYQGGLYHLSHSMETTLAFVMSQTQFWWPDRMRRKAANKSYLEMASDICGTDYRYEPLFYPTHAEKRKAAETKAKMGPRVVAWVLGGSRFDKVFPYSSQAIARIIKELGVPVMMIGKSGRDFQMAEKIQKEVAAHNATDKDLHLALSPDEKAPNWPLRRSLAQLLTCDLVVTPDTGSYWAVAMEPMPKILLLSHASVENIAKHGVNVTTLHAEQNRVTCWPCHRLHDNHSTCNVTSDGFAACMNDLSVEVIVNAARKSLHG